VAPEAVPQLLALTRRSFVLSAGAFSVGVAFVGDIEATAATKPLNFSPNAWVTIDGNGIVTIQSAPAELGQGTMTGLPACLAEDLDADWSKVRVVQSPAQPQLYGNRLLQMAMSTHGDFSTRGYYQQMRLTGAQTRSILLANAARLMKLPLNELATEPGGVIHARSGRRLSYGLIARRAELPEPLPVVTVADLKPPTAWRLIGKPLPRVDIPVKVNGTAVYGIDVQRPNLLYAAILYPPVPRERPLLVDEVAARKVAGFIKVVRCDHFVGIIGTTVEATTSAKALLSVTWSTTTPGRRYDTRKVPEDYRQVAADLAQAGVDMASRGAAAAAIAGASRVLTREFSCDHVAHTAIEPMNGTAIVNGDLVELWLSTQSPSAAIEYGARAAGTAEDKVTVHTTYVGGGFGRLSDDGDGAFEAVLMAKAMPGRAVKLIRSREDDFLNDKFRPLAAQRIDVGLNATGDIVGWRHRIVSSSAYGRFKPQLLEILKGHDYVTGLGGDVLYGWPNHLVQFVRAERGWDVGPWRGIAFGYTVFAIETTINELAVLKAADPLAYRIALLGQQPRAVKVLQTVAAMANWGQPQSNGRALGLALASMSDSIAATIAEISLQAESGKIRVHRVWCAIDAGIVVNPDSVVAQLEGGTIMGLGPALYEQVDVHGGEMQELNFGAYTPPRMSQIPDDLQVQLVPSDSPPGGVGEIGVTLIAPAIANAVARLSGKHLRVLPMLPERVKLALAG
jgi:isoquinoline 1-oxidoreductase subunit beta